MPQIDDVLAPWLEQLDADAGGLALFDAHTHIGRNDPDGFKQTPEELLAASPAATPARSCSRCTSRTATRRPTTRPWRPRPRPRTAWLAFCRVEPATGTPPSPRPAAASTRAPAASSSTRGRRRSRWTSPAVRDLIALAHERERARCSSTPAAGSRRSARTPSASRAEFPDAQLILAHAAISDLAWLWRELPNVPERLRGHVLVEPGRPDRAVHARAPGPGAVGERLPVRQPDRRRRADPADRAAQAGLPDEALRSVAGGQIARLVEGEAPLDLGPGPGIVKPRSTRCSSASSPTCAPSSAALFVQADHERGARAGAARLRGGRGHAVRARRAAVLELLDLFDGGHRRSRRRRAARRSRLGRALRHRRAVRRPHAGRPARAAARDAVAVARPRRLGPLEDRPRQVQRPRPGVQRKRGAPQRQQGTGHAVPQSAGTPARVTPRRQRGEAMDHASRRRPATPARRPSARSR